MLLANESRSNDHRDLQLFLVPLGFVLDVFCKGKIGPEFIPKLKSYKFGKNHQKKPIGLSSALFLLLLNPNRKIAKSDKPIKLLQVLLKTGNFTKSLPVDLTNDFPIDLLCINAITLFVFVQNNLPV